MNADDKICPRCAESVKRAALVCRYCGYEFQAASSSAGQAKKDEALKKNNGCMVILAIAVVAIIIGQMAPVSDEQKAANLKADQEKTAKATNERRAGLHCLSAWDGSSRSLVAGVKERLRDPSSFEHISTRVAPVEETGNHAVVMQYRARNGFGGMNVSSAIGAIRQSDCSLVSVITE